MSNIGNFKVSGTSVRAAGPPTFIPNLVDPTKNHAMVTGIVNRGPHPKTNLPMTERITLHFWNKLASVAACYINTGKQFNVDGNLRVHVTDTGQVRNGKKVLNSDASIRVSSLELLSDSKKTMDATFAQSLVGLIAAGKLPPGTVLTYDDFFPKKEKLQAFNPGLSAQTGMYGHAKVWTKDQNFWGSGVGTAAAVGVAPTGDVNAIIAGLQAQLKAFQGVNAAPVMNQANEVIGGPVTADPFEG